MNYKLNEELKNTVRSITEPCEKCEGYLTIPFTPEEVSKMTKVPERFAKECDECNGKGWCPELEFGCEIEFEQEGQKYIDVVAEVFEEKKIFRPVDAYTDAVSFYNINKNLGKPLETREILLAISTKGKAGDNSISVYYKHNFPDTCLHIYNITDSWDVEIPFNIQPSEYSDELKKEIIKLLKK